MANIAKKISFTLHVENEVGTTWIHWAQDRDMWRTLVNTVMNLQVP
jgi:hypothetical protein